MKMLMALGSRVAHFGNNGTPGVSKFCPADKPISGWQWY